MLINTSQFTQFNSQPAIRGIFTQGGRYPLPNLAQAGIVLGMKKLENGKEQIYYVGDDVHTLCIGATRSGKSRTIVVQSICTLGLAGESLVVSDPKGSILVECGQLLQRNGYEIKVLNTIDFSKSMKYNPFAYIRSEKDILKFVTALIANTKGDGKSSDPFWEKAETLLYCALIGYIFFETGEDEQNMNSLVAMINSMEVREEDETYKNAVDYLFEELAEKDPNHFAVRQYEKYRLAAGKTAKSILISCGARLAVFDIKEVRELMNDDEMELDTIGDRKTALFIIISDTDYTFSFIAALMYSQLFHILCDKADNEYAGRLPVHVRFLLDEFANIGKIPRFEKLIATIRSREISACVILQAQSQLKSIYKDDAETITGNMDAVLFLGGKEKTTLKDLTETLGKETVYMLNNSISKGNNPSYSQNTQKLGKDLMSIDELSVMDGMKCILQLRGVRSFLSDKYDITKHKNYCYLSDANPKNIFDIGKYVRRKLKVDPNEHYEFFEYAQPEDELPDETYDDFPVDLEPI